MNLNRVRATPAPKRQRGVVLFIALIVLVAMTLAGIGMMRSVDTANVVAGNLGFKQASMQYADYGIDKAFQWLLNSSGAQLDSNDTTNGYYASVSNPQDWNDASIWAAAKCVSGSPPCTADALTQNRVSYVIHRLCLQPTAYNGQVGGIPNQCTMQVQTSTSVTGSSSAVGTFQFSGKAPSMYYRITARVQGPKNTVSYVQVMALLSQ